MKLAIGVVGVAAMALLLAGCAPSTPASTPSASPTTPSSATPIPTATAAAADPQVRVPLHCADLFSTSTVGALLGVPVTLAVDETTAPTDLDSISQVQRGILTCTWGGKDKTDSGYDQALSIYIEPDATADFTTNFPAIKDNFGKPVVGTYGDQSAYSCEAGGGQECGANVLVGSYWMTVDLHDLDASKAISKATELAHIKKVLDKSVGALKAAGAAAPAWTPPAGGLLPFCAESGNTTIVRTAFKSKGLVSASDDPGSGQDVSTIGQQGSSFARCDWEQKGQALPAGQYSEVYVNILDGGIWSLPHLVASPPTQWYVGTYKPVTIPGAQGAVLACNSADCDAIVGVGTNAVEVGFSDLGSKRNIASLKAFVAALASN